MEVNKLKPRELKPFVKRLIVYRAITQRKMPREFLANELIKEIGEAGEIPPAFETAKRYISKARNSDGPLEAKWNLACCSEYSTFFTPESILILVGYKEYFKMLLSNDSPNEEESHKLFGVSSSDFTIRQCIWIIRLKPLIDLVFSERMAKDESVRRGYPVALAMLYAMAERSSEIMGEDKFDSSELDNALISGELISLSQKAGEFFIKSGKVITCNHNCESCKYEMFDIGMCTLKHKEN